MENTNSILSMTEHAIFVWPSYAIVAAVMVGLVVFSVRALKRTEHALTHIEATAKGAGDET